MASTALSSQIRALNQELKSPKDIIQYKEQQLESGQSFPSQLAEILETAIALWLPIAISSLPNRLGQAPETKLLFQTIYFYMRLVEDDPSLEEEASREGSHRSLSKIINLDASGLEEESDQDVLVELQDVACEIAALSTSFPARAAPFTLEELKDRLPLSFRIEPVATTPMIAEFSYSASSLSESIGECENEMHTMKQKGFTILINQVKARQSAQKDVGFGKK